MTMEIENLENNPIYKVSHSLAIINRVRIICGLPKLKPISDSGIDTPTQKVDVNCIDVTH